MHTDREADAGSITIWVLGMVLVVSLVGWMGIGAWSAFGERRELSAAADQAAQAGATALDLGAARIDNARQLNPAEAEARAWDSLTQQDLGDVTDVSVTATEQRIVVVIESEISTGLLGVFADDDQPFRISVTAIGTPKEGATP